MACVFGVQVGDGEDSQWHVCLVCRWVAKKTANGVCVWCAGGCRVVTAAEDSLTTAAGLLGVDREELRDSLVSRVMQATRGGVKGTAIK